MTIEPETRNKIRRLFYAEHFTINAICEALSVHHDTVRRAIEAQRFTRPKTRESMIAPYRELIEETLAAYPRMTATRLGLILQDRGFTGTVSNLRRAVRPVRKKIKEAFVKRSPLPGEEAQADWAHFGSLPVEGGTRKLHCFVMVLAYSRMLFARFTYDLSTWSLLSCHLEAFLFWQMVPRSVLYDNMKSIVTERTGDVIRFNEKLLEFSGHYHFNTKVCHPYRGSEKGRVERAIRFIRGNFFEGRKLTDIDTLNRELDEWQDQVANCRGWPDNRDKTVSEKFLEEKGNMLDLPATLLIPEDSRVVTSGKQPYIHYDSNQYTIPPEYVGKPLNLRADAKQVRFYSGTAVIAKHARSFAKRKIIRDPAHEAELLRHKKAVIHTRHKDEIVRLPAVAAWLQKMVDLGEPLEASFKTLQTFYNRYGSLDLLEEALGASLTEDSCRPAAIERRLVELARERGMMMPPLRLPDRAAVKNLDVKSHPLDQYDKL